MCGYFLLATYDEDSEEDSDLHVNDFNCIDVWMRVANVQENRNEIQGKDGRLNIEVLLIAPKREIVEEFPLLKEKHVDEWTEEKVE